MGDDLPFRSGIMRATSARQPRGVQGHEAAPRLQTGEEVGPDLSTRWSWPPMFFVGGDQLDSADRVCSKAGWQKNSCLPGKLMVGREPGTR